MTMPFGKYKGDEIEDLPSSYLCFLIDDCELKGNLRKEVLDELGYRYGNDQVVENKVYVNNKDVKTIYRELSLKHHPDKGGSHEAMIAINEFYERLIK